MNSHFTSKRLLTIALLLFSILSGCASVKRTEIATDKVYPDVRTAALDTKPIINAKYGDFVNVKIENISPSVNGEKSPNKFEAIGIDAIKGQPFTVQVSSICDCLGFRKWIVSPVPYLFSQDGELIAQEQIISPTLKILKGIFPTDGQYKIIVVADNTHEGKKIGDALGNLGVVHFSLPEEVHPTGLIQVNWLK